MQSKVQAAQPTAHIHAVLRIRAPRVAGVGLDVRVFVWALVSAYSAFYAWIDWLCGGPWFGLVWCLRFCADGAG